MNADTSRIIDSWLVLAAENRGTERFQISYTAFRSIVSGRAPLVSEIAHALNMPVAEFRHLVGHMANEGRLTLDASRDLITGAGGLSLVESGHRLDMFERSYSVWCALDAVGIPAGLGVDATVHSYCVDTGVPVMIDIDSGTTARLQPEDAVISLLPPTLEQSLRECCCPMIDFYQRAENVPSHTVPVTIAQAMDLGRRLWRDGIPL